MVAGGLVASAAAGITTAGNSMLAPSSVTTAGNPVCLRPPRTALQFALLARGGAKRRAKRVPDDSSLHFLSVGDWGGLPIWPFTTPGQIAVAETMGKIARKFDSKFALSVGDHFYFSGVSSVDDPRWRRSFENVYTARSLRRAKFWRPVLGNHDYDGNATAQLLYPKKHWHFPSAQYSWRETLDDDGRTTVDFVMLDTILLCGPDSAVDRKVKGAEKAWRWVEAALAGSDADYLIVSGHYPVWSPSSHGPTRCLVRRLQPLLTAAKASVYFSGHDHCLFHVGARGGTQFHGVGAGFTASHSTKNRNRIPPDQPLKFHWGGSMKRPFNALSGGFVGASVRADALTITHYDSLGTVLSSSRVPPRAREPACAA